MMCPLLTIAMWGGRRKLDVPWDCAEEGCAWWHGEERECAVMMLAVQARWLVRLADRFVEGGR